MDKILITDYSSVAFDFAYMKKPIIYYQFDSDKYYNNHYPRGYFKYNKDGFGNVVYSQNNLTKKIEDVLMYGLNKVYNDNIDRFFEKNDLSNSYRIYKEIKMI